MSSIFDLLKRLSEAYSVSLQELLKDILNNDDPDEFYFEDGLHSSYYEKLLKVLDKKIHLLQTELNEKLKLRKELEDKLQTAKHKEKNQYNYENYENYFHNERKNQRYDNDDYQEKIARCYAAMEIPFGSNLEEVKKAYRTLLKKYHPDFFGTDPDKQKTANLLCQRLTEIYKELEAHLKGK
ncbi:MAG: hypothetical protein A2Y41_01010 [Spirochaetes bacterium GWB1_36_13]|nr:MAG: hypothetical protein A2Y41_01010 [Spirochaetes bacterium GWB1_36_13]